MVLWVFGYGSIIWKAGFDYDERRVGFIKGYRRLFHQGSTDHRGTPANPGRTVTLEPHDGHTCWGVAYRVSGKEAEEIALSYLEVREKEYDQKAYVDFYFARGKVRWQRGREPDGEVRRTQKENASERELQSKRCSTDNGFHDEDSTEPAISGVLVYIASTDKNSNKNYLGPAPLEMMAHQIVGAVGPSGPNIEYLFQLETALLEIGCNDSHVTDLANAVRKVLTCKDGDATSNGDAKY